jgi:excisionase family DNA binding protein
MNKNIYTPAQAAEILGMKTSSIYALISRHELAADKVGRSRYISLAQLDAYMKNRGTKDVVDYTYAG